MEPSSTPQRSRDQLRNDFGSVVREQRPPLIAFLRRYTGDENAASDLAQDTFVKAYFQLNRFDDRRPFGPWLFTIAANAARDYLRKTAREVPLPDEDTLPDPAASPAPDDILLTRERQEALNAAITALPPVLREPILLHYQLDWPVAEIAAHLNTEPGAIKTRLHRARRLLRATLNPEPAAHEG